MEIRHIRYFAAVAEELHFGRAARRLGISQPPLSMQIRALERELGVTLFDRHQRHVALTESGKVLLREARKVLSALDQAMLLTRRSADGMHGSLTVGFITPAEYSFLPGLLRSYRNEFPGVALQLRESMTDTQIEALKAGLLDVALLSGQFREADFECAELMAEPLVAAIPAGHALARGGGAVPAKRLATEDIIMFPRIVAPLLYDEIASFCREAGFDLRAAQEARQTQTIISLVSAGLGIGIVPASIRALKRKGVVYRDFRERTPLARISAVWSTSRSSRAITNFVAMAKAAARGA